MSNFDNEIINAIGNLMKEYFKEGLSFWSKKNNRVEVNLYAKEWSYDEIGKVVFNYIHFDDELKDYEITIGLSKNFDGYYIYSELECLNGIFVKSKANSLGGIVDEITKDILSVEDKIISILDEEYKI